ncbi:MAG: PhzF family phenazine biosynthesis protein, partial [Chthoniobacterales bacterium]|nr:PhzF family phenazine biosynthesis protein [Chthoniobacterales bacterium]
MSAQSIPYFDVFAFTNRMFAGNPAGVCLLTEFLPNEQLQAIATQNDLPETAFLVDRGDHFDLRWMTPAVEVDLCGHATLASAHCLFEEGVAAPIRFVTRSGVLTVDRSPDGLLAMDFPSWPPTEIDARAAAAEALGSLVEWTGRTDNEFFLLALVSDERSVRDLKPDLHAVGGLDASAVIVTGPADPGQEFDFVSRLFAPKA